jgi:hypothetical protein
MSLFFFLILEFVFSLSFFFFIVQPNLIAFFFFKHHRSFIWKWNFNSPYKCQKIVLNVAVLWLSSSHTSRLSALSQVPSIALFSGPYCRRFWGQPVTSPGSAKPFLSLLLCIRADQPHTWSFWLFMCLQTWINRRTYKCMVIAFVSSGKVHPGIRGDRSGLVRTRTTVRWGRQWTHRGKGTLSLRITPVPWCPVCLTIVSSLELAVQLPFFHALGSDSVSPCSLFNSPWVPGTSWVLLSSKDNICTAALPSWSPFHFLSLLKPSGSTPSKCQHLNLCLRLCFPENLG